VNAGRVAGDVWANIAYQGNFAGANALPGGYGWQAITHELGHSLGLSHTGDYNASDDDDGDGQPDPISYGNDAYFAQDSQQYSIMSYFDGRYTGQAAVDWDTGTFVYTQTPGVHDILAVQEVYGADYTTRSGDTTYGFNSTADRDIFDFTLNDTPVLTIWDGGGNDTLDLSGFESDSLIDINEGAFSSAGHNMSAEYLDYFASLGLDTQPELDAFYARNGLGPDGSPVDNIAIAYGAKIENAIGGSGDDLMIGNDLNNKLVGNDGDDILIGGLGKDDLTGGAGADTFVFQDTSMDKIRDFQTGVDKIDLSAFDIDSHAIKIAGSNLFADTDGDGRYDLHLVIQGSHVDVGDLLFG
jgi:Ca2+-binding RTX toxin-like protein